MAFKNCVIATIRRLYGRNISYKRKRSEKIKILRLLEAKQITQIQAAKRLGISERQVKNHPLKAQKTWK